MESIPRSNSSIISFPTLPASPTTPSAHPHLPTSSTAQCLDTFSDPRAMPPPGVTVSTHPSNSFEDAQHSAQLQRHSIASDDSSAASSADYFGASVPISRPISATSLASSRPSSIVSNASSGSHVHGQLTSCADLLSPGLASALGLIPSPTVPAQLSFPASARSSTDAATANPPRRRVRAQSAHTGALANRHPSLPTVPTLNPRFSVASVSSFESLPEDEMVHGFLSPNPSHSKSRSSNYDRIPRIPANAVLPVAAHSASTSSLASSSAASINDSPNLADEAPSDTHSSAHGTATSSESQSSTISAGSTRPSAFLRRAATAPHQPTDSSLMMAHRHRSARELLETERSFVASLTLIDQEYYQPLMASLTKSKASASSTAPNAGSSSATPASAAAPILSRKSISDIFSNFYDILQLNRELLSQLEERFQAASGPSDSAATITGGAQPATSMTWNAATDCVGDILVTLAPFLKMYSLFVKNFSSALQRIEHEQRSNDAFARFLKDTDNRRASKEKVTTTTGSVRHAFGYGLGFQAHLLTIVQRIPRYKLLVDDLVKSTPESHPDCADIRRASRMIEQVASYINENVRQHEMVLTMLGLQKSLQGLTEPLVAPGRSLIKRGTLMKTCRRNIQPREFFLFTDCLIYASPISGSIESASAAWTMLAQRGGLYASAAEHQQSPTMGSVSSSAASPIESVLSSPSVAGAPSARARLGSTPEPYTPLAGAIFSLAGHQLQFRAKFGLRDCTVVSVEDSANEGLRHRFEIRTPDKSFAVYAESQASKEAWVNCIREARADHMSARRTLKAEEDSIEAKRERRRSLYKSEAAKGANRRLSTQSLGAYLASTNLIGQDKITPAAADEPTETAAPRSLSREREPAPRRMRVDSLPNLLMRPPSFPSFPASGANLSLANLLASNTSTAAAAPLRVLEDYNAPVWVPDNRADKCCNCQEAFGMWRRKHHCRLCGQVVCWTCSQRSFLIPSYHDGEPDRPARACDRCYDSVFPPEAAEEADAAADSYTAPESAEMSSVPSTSTDDSVANALGAYRLTSDVDTDAEGSYSDSPVTPPVGRDSPAAHTDVELPSAAMDAPGKSALAKKGGATLRPKSLRFEALPPAEMSLDVRDAPGGVSPSTPSSPTETTPSVSNAATPAEAPVRRGSASAHTSPMRSGQMPALPARSKSLAGALSSASPHMLSSEARLNRASALEAHHLFTSHRTPQIQAATSGSGTFRLVTPRLTTPEAEVPPGMGKRSGYGPSSIMDAGYFGSAAGAIQEDAEDQAAEEGAESTGASPVKSEPFRPWMMHAMSPAGGAHLRPAKKRPLSAAARLSRVYGPLLASNAGAAAAGTQSAASASTDSLSLAGGEPNKV
ncbi:predicted Rho/Rac guanine nucleotide exchange factor [Moesziomyces antarcticus T-34]|uniref:Predicted Rho/Rac guanine nucleotide exchange factor n=1 Tax=Pseudozyma antarctica (strain T-34) TaxID=1151754 RepID=M9MDT8_PSEA3|nr:predicted Rho/Rac guanine nucleotide exchange factor [Moesziomyces antarcticus T-34]